MFSNHLNAVALIDRDYALNSSESEGIFQLPVAMVENFLLDPEVVWEAIQSVAETSGLHSVADVTRALTDILSSSESEEAERRALSLLGTSFFRPRRPIGDVPSMAEAFSREVVVKYSGATVATAAETARAEVEMARANDRRREDFHGKDMLGKFYSAHLAKTALSRVVFTFEAARHARQRKAITQFFDGFFGTVIPSWAAQQAVAADGAASRS